MSRAAVSVVAGAALLLASTLAATPQSGVSLPPGQVRDAPAPQPQVVERRIPIGTATISGTVTNADGRPIVAARVIVSGQIPQNVTTLTAPGALPARGTPAVAVVDAGRGVAGGVPGGIPGTPGGAQVFGSSMTPSNLSRTVMTDANGQFSFARMPAGQFTLSVSHNQYLSLNYGQRRSGGPGKYVPLADGQQLDLKIAMLRGGAISGTIYSPDGVPQPNVQVRGSRYSMLNGVKRLQSTGFANSDDRGMYRMFGLQPGDYVISATPSGNGDPFRGPQNTQADQIERAIASGQVNPPAAVGLTPTVSVSIAVTPQANEYVPPPGYLPTFAPNSQVPVIANAVTIVGNDEKTGVDVFLRYTQASVVQGDVPMIAMPGVQVQLAMYADDPLDGSDSFGQQTDTKGKFMFRSVRPGKYTVFAQTVPAPAPYIPGQPSQTPTPLTDAQKLWGRASVTVAGEPTIDVSITLKPARSISGIVLFEMQRPPDLSRTRLMVGIQPAADSAQQGYFGQQPQAQIGPDGRFTLTGVVPGRYQLRVSGGGAMKSAIVGSQDTLDFPYEFNGENDVSGAAITMTDVYSDLSGTLTDPAGKPASDYIIVVAATESRYWMPGSRRIATVRPGPDGRYTLRGLAPGSYYLAVVGDLEQGAQYDPEFLRSLSTAAVTVTMMEGGKLQQDLRVK